MPERIDYAIVGGGVAGLYAAWRLTSPDAAPCGTAPPSVVIFEQHAHLGGRIRTIPIPDSTASVEMGAMRFWKAQQLLTSLLDQIKVPIEPFPGNQEQVSCYFRGVQLRPPHFSQPANVPFRLQGAEVGQSVEALLVYALTRIGELATLADLTKIGFWNALQRVLSSEAYKLLLAGMGDRSALSNWHAGEAMRLMSFIGMASAEPLYRPVKGFKSLVDALAHAGRAQGTRVTRGRRLLTVEPATDGNIGSLLLTFEAADTAEREQVIARTVILALPKRALSDLMLRSHASLDSVGPLETLLDSVNVFSAFKLFASYSKPWWTSEYGYSVTDLPLRTVYYGAGVGGTDADNKRVLLACYADAEPALFWGPLAAESRTVTGPSPARPPVLAQAMDQLSELHSLRGLPEPEWWQCRDWDAHGGAWHAWRPGVDVPATMANLRKPFQTLPLFVCGEAFSRMQGWIEGALMTTERTLESPPFNLSKPAWIPPDYDLGP